MSTHLAIQNYGLVPVFGTRTIDYFPLVNSRVHYDLIDVQSLATLIQTYTSNASLPLGVNYVFPLPSDASVCSFKAVIDGKRTIKAIVEEKAIAKAEYNEAVSQGKTAALLEKTNGEIFQVPLGNIQPKSTIEIYISFASVVSHHGDLDSLRLTFPTRIAPKSGAAPNSQLNYMSNVRSWSHPLIRSFKSALDFSVAVQMTSHIISINSPSHPIAMKLGESTLEPSTEFDPFRARISLSSPTLLDKNIVIVLSCQGLDKPRCTVESFSPAEGSQEFTDAYALTFVPRFEVPSQEFIFLIDRSGSMQGGKIQVVRSALQIMLRSLPTRGTTFNLLSFGTGHSSLWPTSVAYSADSLKAASEHVDRLEANYGGTEIRSALETAFGSRTKDVNTPTTVFILTDGEAYDLAGVQTAITQHVSQSKGKVNFLRVFCMGIGDAVSKAMCDMIARAGEGTTVYVGEEEKPDQKLMGLLRAARGALVENLSVDWVVPEGSNTEKDDFDFEMVSSKSGSTAAALPPISLSSLFNKSIKFNNDVPSGPDTTPVKLAPPPTIQQAPASKYLPPMYPGFRTSIFAIVKRPNARNSAPSKVVRISGSALGRQVVLEVAVTPAMAPEESLQTNVKLLHVLAAQALVQRFEDEGKAGRMTRKLKAEVLRIAKRYGIASSETSFVAIDESGVKADVVQPFIVSHTYTTPPGGFGGGRPARSRRRERARLSSVVFHVLHAFS
ncbi:von Willebrand factor type A domain-containing protein [Hysterangium stoloniferum]|nr:von Willebrand factor type A domain-containing protein [Hysterangium stoloniferum]